jgi:polysaccharide biosynthesis protein PslH
MHLLVVCQAFPSPATGPSTRNYHLLRALAGHHAISVLTLASHDEVAALALASRSNGPAGLPMGERDLSEVLRLAHSVTVVERPTPKHKRVEQVRLLLRGQSPLLSYHSSPALQAALTDLLRGDRYDAVLFESALMAGYRLPNDANLRVIVDEHNVEHALLRRIAEGERTRGGSWARGWYNRWESRLLAPVEIDRCRRADLVLVTSEPERRALESSLAPLARTGWPTIRVVPNGVDLAAFSPTHPDQEVQGPVVFAGAMDYYPNVDAVRFFARHCWPLIRARCPDATWLIVGRDPSQAVRQLAALPGVTVTGTVPDVRPYLAAAAVVVAPLRVGGGTRLKILEAWAMGRAVVATRVGCEGLESTPGEHLFVADEPETLARAVVALLGDPAQRRALGVAGRALAAEHYSWERSGQQLLDALEQFLPVRS